MAILKVANIHFDAAGTNRLDYLNDGTIRSTSNIRITNATTDPYIYLGEGTGINDFGYMRWDRAKNRIVLSGGTGEGLVLAANGQEGLLFTPSPTSAFANVNIRSFDFQFNTTTATFKSLTDFQFRTVAEQFDPANLTITSTGNVLIGRTESTIGQNVKLDVNGAVNASAYLAGTGRAILNNSTAIISTGYTVTTFNAGSNISAYGTWTPNPANGNYQVATANGAVTIATPPANCAIDILFINASNRNPGSVAFVGYNVSATPGSTYAVTANQRYILSIREIDNVSTYSWYAMQ